MSDSFNPGFHLTGRGGELVQGYNLLATLGKWDVTGTGNRETARVTVHDHIPDPYHLDHPEPSIPLSVELPVGKTIQRYTARILSTSPVLVIEIDRPKQ